MAVRDVKNFKFLSEAIVQRFRDLNLKSFRGIPYEPQTNPRSIFGQVYSTFREMIGKGLNLHQYLNIGERSVLENLYRNLQSDINLKFLNNPDSILNDPRFELPDQYYLEQSPEMTAAQQAEAASAQTPAGAPVSTMPGGMRLPSAPRISFGSRRVYNAPHTPEPPPPKSELVTANKSGVIQETPSGAKLVTASSSGVIKEAPPKQIFIANKQGIVTGVQNIKPPSWLKTFGSNAQIFAKRNLGKVFDGLKGIGGGLGRGIAGGIGGGLEAAAPSLGRAFRGGLNGIERMTRPGGLSGGGGISSITKVGKGRGKWVFIFALLGMMFLTTLLGGLTGTTPPGQAGPLPPGGGDISKCEFTRGPEKPKETTFKSSLLLSYIQEASQKASIPAVVLAAFIRVESPSSSNMSNDQISNYSANCAESDTGALGIMQIQPPGTTSKRGDPASCDDCIDAGAKLVGKTVSTMTRQDYCDPRTNIIVGAGWILKKMSKLGYGDGTKWNPEWTNNRQAIETLVKTYYGCFNYGGATDCTGPYNYADDVSTSIQYCKVQPVPPGTDFASQLVNKIKTSQGCNYGFVTKSNYDACLPSIQIPPLPPLPQLSVQAIHDSVFNVQGGVLQCVGFIKAVVTDLINQAGDAIDYSKNNVDGYQFIRSGKGQTIKAGDLPVWETSSERPWGHIAYVVNANDDGSFMVAEANFCTYTCGRVDFRIDTISSAALVGWLRKSKI